MSIGGFGVSGPAFVRASSFSFDVIARWVETLHGHGDFRAALEHVAELLSGDTVSVSRCAAGQAAKSVAVLDRNAGKLFSNRRVQMFAPQLADALGIPMKDGSVWILSELLRDGVIDLPHDMQDELDQLTVRDFAVVALETGRDQIDYLEIHFQSTFADHDRTLLIALASTLARSWKARLPGTAERLIAQSRFRRAVPAEAPAEVSILDITNPAGLSRSEFRICMLVREGLLTKEIAKELNIRKSTMSSHLRSIYAKTGVASHVELVHSLSRGDTAPPAPRQTA